MHTYIALLRGINVGGNNKVEMSRLKSVFESIGHTEVSTYINSGNVIFRSAEKEVEQITKKIEKEIESTYGFTIKIIIREGENIKKLSQQIPEDWKNDTKMKTDVLFLWPDYCKQETLNLINFDSRIDNLIYLDGAVIWNIERKNYNRSGMHKFIGSVVYKNMTARNVNTVRKLAKLV